MMELLAFILLPIALIALVYAIEKPSYMLYAGFFMAGILITANLPVVGTKLAPPDIPLLLFLLGSLLRSVAPARHNRLNSQSIQLPLLFGFLFVFLSFISFAINAIRYPSFALGSFIDVLNYTYGFFIMLFITKSLTDWQQWQNCFMAWVLGAVIVGFFACWGLIGGAPEWVYDSKRISSTLSSINQMQSYLAPIIVALLLIGISNRFSIIYRLFAYSLGFILMVAMLGTGSRSALVFVFIVICIILFFAIKNNARNAFRLTAIVSSIALVGLFFLYWSIQIWEHGAYILPDSMKALARPISRFQLMMEMSDTVEALGPRGEQLMLVKDNWHRWPIIGLGPGNFKEVMNHHHAVHNSYLGVLIEHGVTGFITFFLFMLSVVYATYRAVPRIHSGKIRVLYVGIFLATLLVLIYGMTAFGVRQRIFWLTLGLALAGAKLAANKVGDSIRH